MSGGAEMLAPWIAALLVAGVVALAVAVLSARSLFAMSAALAAAAAMTAGAIAALGAGDGALALMLGGAGLAPILLLGGVLLSARAAKAQRRGVLFLAVGAVAAGLAAVAIVAPELTRVIAPSARASDAPIGLWLAALIFCVIAAVVALLGYGERGALEPGSARREL